MKRTISSGLKKVLKHADCQPITFGKCLQNESFTFQLYIEAEEDICAKIQVRSPLQVFVYEVINKKGSYDAHTKTDDFYIESKDGTYPELLQKIDELSLKQGETKTLFFEIPADWKDAGEYNIDIIIGEFKSSLPLCVLPYSLPKTDLINTNWIHIDGICNYYHVEPFSNEFYVYFLRFLKAYVKLGNTMLLVPMFTPPLDTGEKEERLTTQLLHIEKQGDIYYFNFDETRKFIRLAKELGIEHFEFCHLFTQWGGMFCPKIIVKENGEEKNEFGWSVASCDERYLKFLQQYIWALRDFINEEGIAEHSYLHLTDEPHQEHFELYKKLSNLIRGYYPEVKIIDALSNYSFVKEHVVDIPAICIQSEELPLFKDVKKLLYYCVFVDKEYITNRYLHMPMVRTAVLGYQLYLQNAQGFLHWGFNFYNTQFSTRTVNPYEELDAGGVFLAGDSFIVYPGKDEVEYSIRYFAIMKAFEEYRLLKAVEQKIGREAVLQLLKDAGFKDVNIYPHEVQTYEAFRYSLYELLK